jgi:hypothetical protein
MLLVVENRELKLRLVVTKVMPCGDLFYGGGKPKRAAGNWRSGRCDTDHY